MGAMGKSGGQQVTDYYMSVHFGIAIAMDALTGVYVNNKTAWEGLATTKTTININLPTLYGGNTIGGGLVGNIDWYPGAPDQLISADFATLLGGTPASMPAYRGVATALFYGSTAGEGFLWTSNNPVIAQNVDFRGYRFPPAPALDQTLARIPAALDSGYIADTTSTNTASSGAGSPATSSILASIARAMVGANIVGNAAGIGASTTDAASHAANAINASSQFFKAAASGNVITVTENNTSNAWVNAVQPVADPQYPYRASTGNSTAGFSYFFDITAFGSPGNDANSGLQDGPSAGVATLTIEQVPETGMTFSLGPEVYTFTSYPGDDANPAFMIYDVFTNTDWGMGYPAAALDTAAFNYAASILFGESLGLSKVWKVESSIEDFVNDILNHIQGVTYLDPKTGLLSLKLIRGDYAISDLPVYGPDQIKMTNYQKKQWPETINEIVVSWTNPVTEQQESVSCQNPSNIAMQQGQIVSDKRNFSMVRNAPLAAKLAARECRMVSAPLDSCEIEVDRSAWASVPGSCIVINYPENGIVGGVFRIGRVDYGSLDSPAIKISLTRDIFSLTPASLSAPTSSQWTNPSTAPTDLPLVDLFTLPYFFQTNTNLQTSIQSLAYPEVLAAAVGYAANRDYVSFDLYGETTLSTGATTWANFGTKTLVECMPSPALNAEATTLIPVTVFPDTARAPIAGGFLLIGTGDGAQEMCQVVSTDGTNYTINRGMLDTVPQAWPAGTNIWVLNAGLNNTDGVNIWSVGEQVTYKLLPRTSQGVLALAAATPHEITMTARPWLPLRPANVQVNGVGFGSEPIGTATNLTITWSTRNRTFEDGQALPWTSGPVAPEYYQETVVTVFDQNGNQVYQQGALWTENELVLPVTYFARYSAVKIVVSSRLNGDLESLFGCNVTITGLPADGNAALPPAPPAATPPPSPIAAPTSAKWSVAGGAVTDTSGNSIPALVISGTPDAASDAFLVVRYRVTGASNWTDHPLITLSNATITANITGVAASTQYDVQIAYQATYGSDGYIMSEWLTVAGSPATTGAANAATATTAGSAGAIGNTTADQLAVALANATSIANAAESAVTTGVATAQAMAAQAVSDAQAAQTAQTAAAQAVSEAQAAQSAATAATSQAESASSAATAEVARAEAAEGSLTQQIVNLSQTVTQNANTAAAAVSSEAVARADAIEGVAGQITAVQASYDTLSSQVTNDVATLTNANSATATQVSALSAYATPNQNLLPNPTGVLGTQGWSGPSGWVSYHSPSVGYIFGKNYSGTPTNGGYDAWTSDPIPMEPGPFTISAHIESAGITPPTSGDRRGAVVALEFYDSGVNYLGEIDIAYSPNTATNGRASGTGTLPANAVSGRVILFTPPGTSFASAALFNVWQIKVEHGSVATAYTDDTTVAAINATVENNQTTQATENSALAAQISAVQVNLGDLTGTVSNNATTAANNNSVLVSQVSTLQAYATPRPNLLQNPTGALGLASWVAPAGSGWVGYTNRDLGGVFGRDFHGANLAAGDVLSSIQYATYAGQVLTLSGMYETHGLIPATTGDTRGAIVGVEWFDASGNYLGEFNLPLALNTQTTNRQAATGAAPANANYYVVRFGAVTGTTFAANSAGMDVWQLKIEEGQPATAYTDDATAGAINATVENRSIAQANATSALASQVTALAATVNTNASASAAALSNETTVRAAADSSLSSQISTLNANYGSLSALVGSNYTALANANAATAASLATLQATTNANPNLLQNPTGALGMQGWTSGGPTAISAQVGNYGEGDYFQTPTGSSASGVLWYQDVAYSGTGPLSIQAELFAGGLTLNSGTAAQVRFYIEWLDSSHGHLGYSAVAAVAAGQDWAEVQIPNQTPPGGVAYARGVMDIWGNGAWTNTNAAWRRLKVESGTICTAYTDDATASAINATITAQSVAQASENSALAAQISTLSTNLGSLSSTVSNNYSSLTTSINTTASQLSTLTSTVGGNSANITTLQSTTASLNGALYGTWGVTVNANGAIAGMVLYASSGNTITSSVVFDAASFIIRSSANPTITPFYYDATSGTLFLQSITVNTINVANNAISNVNNSFTSAQTNIAGNATSTIQTLTISASGSPIIVLFGTQFNTSGQANVTLKLDGTAIYVGATTSTTTSMFAEMTISPAAGNRTLTLEVANLLTTQARCANMSITTIELKK